VGGNVAQTSRQIKAKRVSKYLKSIKSLGLLLCLVACRAQATLVVERSLEQLLRSATIVVYGQVVQIEVDSGSGFRTAIVEVKEIAKAPADLQHEREFYVPLLNRALPHTDLVEFVSEAPELRWGQEVLLCLQPVADPGVHRRLDGRPIYALLGLFQGKFTVLPDRLGVRRLASFRDLPEEALSAHALQAQRSTPRLQRGILPRNLNIQAPEPPAMLLSEELPGLDAVLNRARRYTEPGVGGR